MFDNSGRLVPAIWAGVFLLVAPPALAAPRVEQTELCRLERGSFSGLICLSPDGNRYAGMAYRGGGTGQSIIVDGKVAGTFEAAGMPVFSADGRHVAFPVREGGKWRIIADGKQGPAYDRIDYVKYIDSGKLIYRAAKGAKMTVVLDGAEQGDFRAVPSLIVSRTGVHWACTADLGKTMIVINDGKRSDEFDYVYEKLIFADFGQLVYRARRGLRWRLVDNGREGPSWDEIGEFTVSRNGDRCAFAVRESRRWSVVIEGSGLPVAGEVGRICLSPDGKRSAFTVKEGEKWRIVVDKVPGPVYDYIQDPMFSPDGKRLAYVAKADGALFLFIDHQKTGPGMKSMWTPAFSEDGRCCHVRCSNRDLKEVVLVNDEEGPPFDQTSSPRMCENGTMEYLGAVGPVLYRVRHAIK